MEKAELEYEFNKLSVKDGIDFVYSTQKSLSERIYDEVVGDRENVALLLILTIAAAAKDTKKQFDFWISWWKDKNPDLASEKAYVLFTTGLTLKESEEKEVEKFRREIENF